MAARRPCMPAPDALRVHTHECPPPYYPHFCGQRLRRAVKTAHRTTGPYAFWWDYICPLPSSSILFSKRFRLASANAASTHVKHRALHHMCTLFIPIIIRFYVCYRSVLPLGSMSHFLIRRIAAPRPTASHLCIRHCFVLKRRLKRTIQHIVGSVRLTIH